jgi:hypothetical protein
LHITKLKKKAERKKKILIVLKTKANLDRITGPWPTRAPLVPLTRPIPWPGPGNVSLSWAGFHSPFIVVHSFASDGYASFPIDQNRRVGAPWNPSSFSSPASLFSAPQLSTQRDLRSKQGRQRHRRRPPRRCVHPPMGERTTVEWLHGGALLRARSFRPRSGGI